MNKVVSAGVALSLVFSLLVPLSFSRGVATTEAGPVDQAATLDVAALCVGSTVGVLACTAFVAGGLAWYEYNGGTGDLTTLQNARDALLGWLSANSGSATVSQFLSQYSQHPNYLDPTANLLTAYRDSINQLNSAGFVTQGFAYGVMVYVGSWTGFSTGSLALGRSTYTFAGTVLPTGGLCDGTGGYPIVTYYGAGPDPTGLGAGLFGGRTRVRYWTDAAETGSPFYDSTYTALTTGGTGDYSGSHSFNPSPASGVCAVNHISVDFLDHTNTAAHPIAGVGRLSVKYWTTASASVTYNIEPTAFVYSGGFVAVVTSPNGTVIRQPVNADEFIGATGTTAIPLATGADGTAVDTGSPTGTAGSTADTHWWEGLFGGVTSGLSNVAGLLATLPSALSTLIADVLVIPVAVTMAIENALVPTTGPYARMGSLISTANGKAPLGWPSTVFAAFAALFDGAGSTCPTIHIVNGYGAFDHTFTFCPPTGTAVITQTLSVVAAAAAVLVWAWNFINRFLGD